MLVVVGIHEAELEIRRALDLFARRFLGRLLEARKLDHNAVLPGRLDDRLRHAKGIHPLAQHLDGLVHEVGVGARVEELVGPPGQVHFEHELGTAPQIEAEPELSGRLPLDPVQDGPGRIGEIA